MAAKRTASNDLNHENWDVEYDPEDAGTFKRAAADVLKGRVIKTARRRNPIGSTSSTDESGEKKNIFGGFTGFAKTPVSTTSAFGFLNNKASDADNQPKVNGIGHHPDIMAKATEDTTSDNEEYFSKLKGLNRSVADWIKTHVDTNPFVNLTPVFRDYEQYFDDLEKRKKRRIDKPDNTQSESIASTSTPQFSFGIKPKAVEKTSDNTDSINPKLMFGVPSSNTNVAGMFSFGSKTSTLTTTAALASTTTTTTSSTSFMATSTPKFSFGAPQTTSATSTTSPASTMFKPSTGFSFGAMGNTGSTGGSAPFTFSNVSSSSTRPTTTEEGADVEEDDPPKVEFTPVTEDGYIYKVRCKVFVKKDGTFGDRGVGNMFLKPIPDSEKMQLIVRADTNLGNLLCNFVLSESIPTKRMGKKDVVLVCIPTPDTQPPPVPILLRVKSPEEADELLATLEKHKK